MKRRMISEINITITPALFHPAHNAKSLFEFVFEAPDRDSFAPLAATLPQVPGVAEVQSVPTSSFALAKTS